MFKPSQPTIPTSPKTAIKIGDAYYDIDISKIPYLSSFVDFQVNAQPQTKEFVHGPIPLFDVALKGIESGYRQCFRSLPTDLSQHHILCDTYHFLCVDVLGGQSINEIFNDLKSGQSDYDGENEAKDSVKVFNTVLYLVSHAATFKWRTRSVIRAAYKERFVVSPKQTAALDKWDTAKLAVEDSEDVTTEDEDSDYFWNSDYSGQN